MIWKSKLLTGFELLVVWVPSFFSLKSIDVDSLCTYWAYGSLFGFLFVCA